jgi:hypothetical protein
MFFNSFLTLISHHQHNQFLQAGDADYLTFGGHVLYESDYLRSLQWHRIGKDSSLQGRNRMSGGAMIKVWVRVVNQNGTFVGGVGKVDMAPGADIAELRVAVKAMWSPDLDSTSVTRMTVFPAGDVAQARPLLEDAAISTTTTRATPLIVLAPITPPTNGKFSLSLSCCCCCCLFLLLRTHTIIPLHHLPLKTTTTTTLLFCSAASPPSVRPSVRCRPPRSSSSLPPRDSRSRFFCPRPPPAPAPKSMIDPRLSLSLSKNPTQTNQ